MSREDSLFCLFVLLCFVLYGIQNVWTCHGRQVYRHGTLLSENVAHFMCYKSLQRWTEPVGQYLLGKFYSKRQSYTDQPFPLDYFFLVKLWRVSEPEFGCCLNLLVITSDVFSSLFDCLYPCLFCYVSSPLCLGHIQAPYICYSELTFSFLIFLN